MEKVLTLNERRFALSPHLNPLADTKWSHNKFALDFKKDTEYTAYYVDEVPFRGWHVYENAFHRVILSEEDFNSIFGKHIIEGKSTVPVEAEFSEYIKQNTSIGEWYNHRYTAYTGKTICIRTIEERLFFSGMIGIGHKLNLIRDDNLWYKPEHTKKLIPVSMTCKNGREIVIKYKDHGLCNGRYVFAVMVTDFDGGFKCVDAWIGGFIDEEQYIGLKERELLYYK